MSMAFAWHGRLHPFFSSIHREGEQKTGLPPFFLLMPLLLFTPCHIYSHALALSHLTTSLSTLPYSSQPRTFSGSSLSCVFSTHSLSACMFPSPLFFPPTCHEQLSSLILSSVLYSSKKAHDHFLLAIEWHFLSLLSSSYRFPLLRSSVLERPHCRHHSPRSFCYLLHPLSSDTRHFFYCFSRRNLRDDATNKARYLPTR